MKKFINTTFIIIAALLCAFRAGAQSAARAHYAQINGLKLYYVEAGQGEPLILLHGALSTINHDYGKMMPTLAKKHRVIGIELQAHGHTADIDRPLTYEAMADDVYKLMETLKITKADFMGYSMGGGVALQLSITHPEKVDHLVLMSTAYSPAGMNFANPGTWKPKPVTNIDQSNFRKAYNNAAPDTSKWHALLQKVYGLMGSWKGFTAEQIKGLKSPVLLLFGDADISKPEHAVEMFRLLGGGVAGDIYEAPNEQLAIIPGTTHVQMPERYELIVPIVSAFLAGPSAH